MVANENLGLICHREIIGTSFLAEKGHFLIFSKKYPHFRVWPRKIEKWVKIALFANEMSQNLVRMYFAIIFCAKCCQTKKKWNSWFDFRSWRTLWKHPDNDFWQILFPFLPNGMNWMLFYIFFVFGGVEIPLIPS